MLKRVAEFNTTEDIAKFLSTTIGDIVSNTRGNCVTIGPKVLLDHYAEMMGMEGVTPTPVELTLVKWALERLADAGYLERIESGGRVRYRMCKTSPLWSRDNATLYSIISPHLV